MSDNNMTTRLVPEVLVVDPLDRELEQLLSACGMRATRGSAAELAALVHPAAQLPTSSSWIHAARAGSRRRWPR